MLTRLMFLFAVFMVCAAGTAAADWSGPTEIISGNWGSGAGQFGMRVEGGFSVAPSIEAVTADHHLIILDPVNKKQVVFNSKGGRVEELSWGDAKEKALFSKVPLSEKSRRAVTVYSQKIGASAYRIMIVFPDKNVTVDSDRDFRAATRDTAGFIYAFADGSVVRFDLSGKKTGDLPLPRAHEELIPDPAQRVPRALYIEYGEPVVAPNGDVYVFQQSDLNYSILKWAWK